MKRPLLLALAICFSLFLFSACGGKAKVEQQIVKRDKIQQNVRTRSGEIYQLNADGTWQAQDKTPRWVTFRDDASPTSLRYDSKKWHLTQKKISPDAQLNLIYHNGDAYAIALIEPTAIGSEEKARTLGIQNAKSVDPNASLVQGKTIRINGDKFYVAIIKANISGMSVVYYNATYSGSKGTLQVISFTTDEKFQSYYKDMVEFTQGVKL